MDTIPLKASARATEAKANALRNDGKVPCVVYGNEVKNTPIQCDYSEIRKAYSLAGTSTIVDLDIDGKKVPALFHAIEIDAVTNRLTHADFYAVNMKKEIDASIPIKLVGEAPAVKELSGILVTTHDHVTVWCLPSNLPHDLELDISGLTEFDSHLTVADLKVPEGVRIDEEPDTMLVTIQEPRAEEPETPAEGEAAEGEGAEGEKKEGGEENKEEEKKEE